MRMIFSAALVLLVAAAPPSRPAAHLPDAPSADRFDPINAYRTRQGCRSIPQQVAGADRRYEGSRLDRQPPGHLLLAVGREIDGCPQATVIGRGIGRR
jgi:hypothetical protein